MNKKLYLILVKILNWNVPSRHNGEEESLIFFLEVGFTMASNMALYDDVANPLGETAIVGVPHGETNVNGYF